MNLNFRKIAAALYDYSASHSRDYYPGSPSMPRSIVNLNPGEIVKMVNKTFVDPPGTMKSMNKANDAESATWPFLHDWSKDISGTGSGRPLWPYPQNPYRT